MDIKYRINKFFESAGLRVARRLPAWLVMRALYNAWILAVEDHKCGNYNDVSMKSVVNAWEVEHKLK